MKIIISLCFSLLFITSNAQSWFDSSCKNIDDKVNEETFKTANERNILKIVINQAGELEINGVVKSELSEIKFKEYVLNYVTNPKGDKDKADKPDKVFIQIKSLNMDREQLENIKSYVQAVYLYLWDKASEEKYETTYIDLNCKKREKVFNEFPLMVISDISKKINKPTSRLRKGPGVPTFGGDVKED